MSFTNILGLDKGPIREDLLLKSNKVMTVNQRPRLGPLKRDTFDNRCRHFVLRCWFHRVAHSGSAVIHVMSPKTATNV